MSTSDPLEQRNRRLRSFVAHAAERRRGAPIEILEVGSWLGGSAIVWHAALGALNGGRGRVVCVDPWEPYEGRAGAGQFLDPAQNELLESGDAFARFEEAIAAADARETIEVRRGTSDDILPTLPHGAFDIVYIDGDHSYAQVRNDIANAMPLVCDGGLLCGDDLEVLFGECNQTLCVKWAELGAEYVRDPQTGLGYHPGVTLAVWRAFGEVARRGLTWAMQRDGDGWIKPPVRT